jgi:predicted RecA/RadA family phage recombinase
MAKNFVQDGATVEVTAPAAISSGAGILIGNLFGIALHDAASGAPLRIRTEGVFEVAKTSALAIGVGDRLFWVPGSSVVNKTTTSQVCVGVAVGAAANPSPTVLMKLAPVAGTPSGT